VGGIVGVFYNIEGSITQDPVRSSLKGSYVGGTVTGRNVGGIAGQNRGTIQNVYSTASVGNDTRVGGIIGINGNEGIVRDSYAAGEITGTDYVGGIVGQSGGDVTDSYWDTEVTGQQSGIGLGTSGANVEGLVTDEMKGTDAETNMTGLDFTNIWTVVDNSTYISYPYLRDNTQTPAPGLQSVSTNMDSRLTGEAEFQNGDPADNVTIDILDTDSGAVSVNDITTNPSGNWGPIVVPPGNYTAVVDDSDYSQFADFSTIVWLSSGETEKIFTTIELTSNFTVTITDTNAPVTEGETLMVTTNVTNTGNAEATQTITLTDTGFNNTRRDATAVTLAPGESNESVTFEWSTGVGDAGSGDVTVMSENDSTTRDVTVDPADTNSPPVATADEYETDGETTLSVSESQGVLTNDDDPDGDSLSASLVTDVSHGELTLDADGSFEYTPDDGFTGEDTFTYQIADGNGETDRATVTISVTVGCIDRRSLGRGQEDKECPSDRGISRGESRDGRSDRPERDDRGRRNRGR
jgi:VCBS repeat-containing protein